MKLELYLKGVGLGKEVHIRAKGSAQMRDANLVSQPFLHAQLLEDSPPEVSERQS